jgi:hypothetical protein
MSRVASRPLITGICTSMSTASKRDCPKACTPCAPSAASVYLEKPWRSSTQRMSFWLARLSSTSEDRWRCPAHGRARRAPARALPRRSCDFAHARLHERQRDVEGAAHVLHALQPDAPAHELHQAPRDAQAQRRAAVAARGGGVLLHEGLEDALVHFRRHADAGVAHGHVQQRLRRAQAVAADDQVDARRAR